MRDQEKRWQEARGATKRYELTNGSSTYEIRHLTAAQLTREQRKVAGSDLFWREAQEEKRVHWLLAPLFSAIGR